MTPLVRSNPPGVGSRALDFKLLGLKGRPQPWQQQEGAFIDLRYPPIAIKFRVATEWRDGSIASFWLLAGYFRSSPMSRHPQDQKVYRKLANGHLAPREQGGDKIVR